MPDVEKRRRLGKMPGVVLDAEALEVDRLGDIHRIEHECVRACSGSNFSTLNRNAISSQPSRLVP